jgi:hypothetical protein
MNRLMVAYRKVNLAMSARPDFKTALDAAYGVEIQLIFGSMIPGLTGEGLPLLEVSNKFERGLHAVNTAYDIAMEVANKLAGLNK